MDLETQKVSHFLEGTHKSSVRNAAVDPQMELLATMSCDGMLHINKISDLTCQKKEKVADRTQNYKPQAFDLVWSPDGTKLYVAGSKEVVIKTRNADPGLQSTFLHDSEVALLAHPSDEVLITYCMDKSLSVWNVEKALVKLGKSLTVVPTHKYTFEKELLHMAYCKRNQVIAYMDTECSIGVIPFDLRTVTEEPEVTVEVADIDMADLAGMMSQEEEEVAAFDKSSS